MTAEGSPPDIRIQIELRVSYAAAPGRLSKVLKKLRESTELKKLEQLRIFR